MKHTFFSAVLLVFVAACAPVSAPPSATQSSAPTSPTAASSPSTPSANVPQLLPEENAPASANEFRTNFKKHTVPFKEILSGGPPKDGIPAIDAPKFVSTREASAWLKDNEPVILFQRKDDVRAYPMQILIWHE